MIELAKRVREEFWKLSERPKLPYDLFYDENPLRAIAEVLENLLERNKYRDKGLTDAKEQLNFLLHCDDGSFDRDEQGRGSCSIWL
jgi:hypothetical protein